VADWARKVLNFTEKSAEFLIEQEIDGAALLLIPSPAKLESYGLSDGAAVDLWAEIEKMKKAQANSGARLNLFNMQKHLMINYQSN